MGCSISKSTHVEGVHQAQATACNPALPAQHQRPSQEIMYSEKNSLSKLLSKVRESHLAVPFYVTIVLFYVTVLLFYVTIMLMVASRITVHVFIGFIGTWRLSLNILHRIVSPQ